MYVMTFEEWLRANDDLVNELRDMTHHSGLTFGFLADIGAAGAAEYMDGYLRHVYQRRLKQDQDNLAAWNRAVASVGVN